MPIEAMKHKVIDLNIIVLFLLLTGISKSLSALHSRKGFFLDDIDPAELDSSETISLKTVYVPSELACSQICFGNELCSYKSFDSVNGKCELLREISSEDVKKKKKVSKKVNVNDPCDSKNCGSKCKCMSLLGTEKYACDCTIEGLSKTSADYVHRSCIQALASNGNVSKTYFIQPSIKLAPVSLKCELGIDGKGYAVFHHNTEAEVYVTGNSDSCGGYAKTFTYNDNMETIIFVINNSISCQQSTKAVCKGVTFLGHDCSWLNGRDSRKLLYWGGGPQNGTGCNCGITGTCANSAYKCNCDINNNYDSTWYTDEGSVTLKDDLPLTGIAIGDTGSTDMEVVKYTIGPLRCII